MNYLALAYNKGLGVAEDEHEAAKWYRRAADRQRLLPFLRPDVVSAMMSTLELPRLDLLAPASSGA